MILENIFFFFLITISSLYSFSRYSNYGNDVPVHIYFFYLTYLVIENKNIKNHDFLFLISLVSIFLISSKIFFILSLLYPIYFILLKKNFSFLKTGYFYILFFLFLIVIFRNILISGCAFYPVSFTCFDFLSWTNLNEVVMQSHEGEAWSKGWSNQTQIESHKVFMESFNWLNAWLNVHFKVIIEKYSPIIIFFIAFFILLYFLNNKKNIKILNKSTINNFNIIFFVSVMSFVFWFLKFPIYRYGYSFILIFTYCIFCITFNTFFKKINLKLILKSSFFI